MPDSVRFHGQFSDSTRAFKPFSLGPRACAGKAMALHQIRLTIARVVWQFDFRAADAIAATATAAAADDVVVGSQDTKTAARAAGQAGTGMGVTIGAGGEGEWREEYPLKANVTSRGSGPVLVFKARQ